MSNPPADLPALQGWMQSVMMAEESSAAKVIDSVIEPSQQQTSRERLNVYVNAYQARLLECLREEFATLCQFLGQDIFDGLAVAYLEAHPSSSYTLANLGSKFPQFLIDYSRQDNTFSGTQFLIDLTTLERLYAEVFDGPGVEGLPLISAETLRRIDPQLWPAARLETVPCLKLVHFEYPVHKFVTACRRGTEPPVPEPRPTWLAVTRRDYIVRRLPLTGQQYELLSLLMQGETIGATLEQVAQSCDDLDAFASDVRAWFEDWTAAGFFLQLRSPTL